MTNKRKRNSESIYELGKLIAILQNLQQSGTPALWQDNSLNPIPVFPSALNILERF